MFVVGAKERMPPLGDSEEIEGAIMLSMSGKECLVQSSSIKLRGWFENARVMSNFVGGVKVVFARQVSSTNQGYAALVEIGDLVDRRDERLRALCEGVDGHLEERSGEIFLQTGATRRKIASQGREGGGRREGQVGKRMRVRWW